MTKNEIPWPQYRDRMDANQIDPRITDASHKSGVIADHTSPELKPPDHMSAHSAYRTSVGPQELATRLKGAGLDEAPNQGGAFDHLVDSARRAMRPSFAAPLKLKTASSRDSAEEDPVSGHRKLNSPSFPLTAVPPSAGSADAALPALRARSISQEEPGTSPKAERLPSFHQISKIADGGMEDGDSRPSTYPRPPLPSSVMSQSPVMSHYGYPHSQQTSPANAFSFGGQGSPTSAHSEAQFAHSPPSAGLSVQGYYADRRRPLPNQAVPPFMGQMSTASTSASGESGMSHQSTGSHDSYSTQHTTPVDGVVTMEGTPRQMPTLPLPPGMPHPGLTSIPGGTYVCDYPGCTAPPFTTQYLLK